MQPDTEYKFTIAAMYGAPGKLKARDTLTFQIKTEKADDGKHGIWFNRGSIASQAFAREFDNAQMTDNTANDPQNKLTRWLSRGLLEACLNFIDQIPAGDGLRVCAYEFTYQPILNALNSALRRGVNVKIVYHKTSANDRAIKTAGLPTQTNGKRILFERTRPKIPHNKFIVRLERDDKPVSVWTGSTNFTSTGFLGQTNVGHLVTEPATAAKYLQFWTELSDNPTLKPAIAQAVALTPNPANLIPKEPITPVFSPRSDDSMLDWYAQRIVDSKTSAVFTGAFGVAPKLLEALEKRSDSVRFILLEKPPTADIRDAEARNRDDVLVSYGAVLGMDYQRKTDSAGNRTLVPIPNFELDKWFFKEELARQNGIGFVFFIHTKFLLVDPLSDDPLVCTGSANFSTGSLTSNDENMLQIRGDTRVADIYLTEFDRIFRHFYFRDIANELAEKGRNSETVFLDSTDTWTKEYFDPTKFKCHRREMFFADPGQNWTLQAQQDINPFEHASSANQKTRNSARRRDRIAVDRKKKPARTPNPASTKQRTKNPSLLRARSHGSAEATKGAKGSRKSPTHRPKGNKARGIGGKK